MSKLLMIDDNPIEHLIMQRIFDRHKLFGNADHSPDGRVMIDFLNENRQNTAVLPDLIFLDLYMPGFTGFDFLERFDRLYPYFLKPINIYVVSSSVNKTEQRRALSYPFVREFLVKPITQKKLENLYAGYSELIRKEN
jgi:CheY-like chemotaxis protein